MSFFAVLDVSDSQDRGHFEVDQCHINLWALSGLWFRRRMFYLDVGIKLAALGADLHAFSLVLPFGTSSFDDLTSSISTRTTAELIFDSDIVYPERGLIQVGPQQMRVLSVSATGQKDVSLSTADVSVWDLKLTSPLVAGQTGYARVRFPIEVLGSVWQWQQSGARRSGAILDFRVLDQRSTATLPNGPDLRARALGLKKVAIFAMVPAWLHGRAIHPDLNYIRVLESQVWASYLGRRAEFRNRPMVVFSWKGNGLSLATPLRIYTDFTIRRKAPSALLVGAATAVAVSAVGFVYEVPIRPEVQGFAQAAGSFISGELEPFVPVTFIGAIIVVSTIAGVGRKAWTTSKKFREWMRSWEEAFFRHKS